MEKIERIKKEIDNGTYDMKAAIEGAASKIVEHPEVLLWR